MIRSGSEARIGFLGGKFQGVQLGQRVAIYCRVSTSDQSCERQERDLLAFANRAGYEIEGVWKEIASGSKDQRLERKKVMAIAQDRRIDAILVTELTRWGRSTMDLVQTLHDLQAWKVSLIAQTGLQFDLSTPQGKLIASLMAALSEFERDLLRERIRSGIAGAKAKGRTFGRKAGERPKSDRMEPKVLRLLDEGRSYRFIARELNLSKNTVMAIAKRQPEAT
jgi:DNA invertase Pin-like site-specific DNA recombinase